ncbi:integrase core domain-containing protein [Streptomyces incanus]|uniref:Integrase core domain-containing protein n=1 Tax=Streptomyces incanus TaxID=887453 RepID=A0ABW0XHY7_9ACTN
MPLSAPPAPRGNARCERVSGAIRREVPGHLLVGNEAHAHRVLAEYREHCTTHRPHRSRDQRTPEARVRSAVWHERGSRGLLRTHVLGGAVNESRDTA